MGRTYRTAATTLVLALAGCLLASSGAGAAGPVDTSKLVLDPALCKTAYPSCDPSLSPPPPGPQQWERVHCGDRALQALSQSALMQSNRKVEPQFGSDMCSFGSNRVRVFGPPTGPAPDPATPPAQLPLPTCVLNATQVYVIPPGVDGAISVQAWGGAGGDYIDPTGSSALGGFGGFAAFDGTWDGSDAAPAKPGMHGRAVQLTSGDVLRIQIGCKPKPPAAGKKDSASRSAGAGGGGSTRVSWIGHVDVSQPLPTDPAAPIPWDNDGKRPDSGGYPTLDSFNTVFSQAGAGAIVYDGGPDHRSIVLVIAGGGGGAARNAGGGDGEIGGGHGSQPAATGLTNYPTTGGNGGRGGNRDHLGAGGVSGSADASANGVAFSTSDIAAGTGGRLSGGQIGGVGDAFGGTGGFATEPGGGGGGGYGGGGAGSDSTSPSSKRSGGGGGGGSFAWGAPSIQSAPLDQDGMVVIQWKPKVLGGAGCAKDCRAIWPTCTVANGHAGGQTFVDHLPQGINGTNEYVLGASGGGSVSGAGTLVGGGPGGYAGGDGASALDSKSKISVQVGCPGTWAKTPGMAGGGGGSTAITVGDDDEPSASPLNSNDTYLVAGGGGGSLAGANGSSGATYRGGAGGVVGTSLGGDSWASGAAGFGPDPGSGGGGSGGPGGSGGSGDSTGRGHAGFGGNGGDGGGRNRSGDYGGAAGGGADGPSTDGWGGKGGRAYADVAGGGGGGGYGGGGGGGERGGSGGGGGSWALHAVTPTPLVKGAGFFTVFPGVWSAFSALLPASFGVPAKIIGGIVGNIPAAISAFTPGPALLANPATPTGEFGYAYIEWGADQGGKLDLSGDKAKPRLLGARLSARRFAVSARRTAVTAKRPPGVPVGTTFRLRHSEPLNVRITISRLRPGRRGAVRVGSLARLNRPPGNDAIPFSGRIGTRRLVPGRYRATIVPIDHAKHRGRAATLSFTVVRR